MKRSLLLILIIGFISLYTYGQDLNKTTTATRTSRQPKIDGKINESCWKKAIVINDFTQYNPLHGENASQKTEIRIIYDDKAIYIAAKMFDQHPDSILRELGDRDDYPNADMIEFKFDTYHKQQDAYVFSVSASGVQRDYRHSDWNYNSVWESAVKINRKGWFAELRIPYSALRFPDEKEQNWGMQINRSIRRNNESIVWAFMEKGLPNYMNYWGTLSGIKEINPPMRLELKPYLTLQQKYYPDDDGNILNGHSISGGADLKYGINESFNVDMTLLPDFSQVKSDNKVKNLSAFETVYSENRPFFIESMDLFKKGGLFYSRRIGQKPSGYYDAESNLDSTYMLTENPVRTDLVNATKFYGRNKNGIGIGMMNAITKDTYAVAEDENNETEKFLTEPTTNYNIAVLDQPLQHNSSIYLINTNVNRQGDYDNANVTGLGTNLKDPNNDFSLEASGSLSQIFDADEENTDPEVGYRYQLAVKKISGNFRFNLYRKVTDDHYDINDMGLNHKNNYLTNGIKFNYIKFKPFSIFHYLNNYIQLNKTEDFTTNQNIDFKLQYGGSATLKNYTSVWYYMIYSLDERYDYYDPRVDGRYIVRPPYFNSGVGISTDNRKTLTLNTNFFISYDEEEYSMTSISLSPKIRVSNRLFVNYHIKLQQQDNSVGYVTQESDDDIIYGNRDLSTFENTLNSRLMLNSNFSVSLWMRHYIYQGEYKKYFELNNEGYLTDNNDYSEVNDFNYNAFNLDIKLNWRFAPGSNMSLVWKNEITKENSELIQSIIHNLENTLQAPQNNTISLKILYHLDYQNVNIFKRKDNIS